MIALPCPIYRRDRIQEDFNGSEEAVWKSSAGFRNFPHLAGQTDGGIGIKEQRYR
jgi:hypothetical protein